MKAITKSQKSAKQDVLYTPPAVAKTMVELCKLRKDDSVLDPSRGNGVFFNLFPEFVRKDWCEITEGRDFFECEDHFDWVIGNPPYSCWDDWLEKTCLIATNFCYLFSFLNFTPTRLNKIYEKGFGLTKVHVVKVDWWFSQSIIAVFEKGKESIVSVEPNTIQCEYCGKRCGRGRRGASYNECLSVPKT